jgi:hypothetical protein
MKWPDFLFIALIALMAVVATLNDAVISLVLGYFAGFLFGITIHELGHVFGCKLAGAKVVSFRILVLELYRSRGRWGLRAVPRGGCMGMVVPQLPSYDDVSGMRTVVLWGPIFTGIASAVFASAWIVHKTAGSPSSVTVFWLLMTVVNLYVGWSGLVPSENEGFASDGRILQILKSPEAKSQVRMGQALMRCLYGMPWRELPDEVVSEILAASTEDAPLVNALSIAFNQRYDAGRFEEAEQFLGMLTQAEEKHAPQLLGNAYAQAVVLHAVAFGDDEEARRQYEHMMEHAEVSKGEREYAAAALALAEGRMADARRHAIEYIKSRKKGPEARFDITWLKDLAAGRQPATPLSPREAAVLQ